MKEKIKLKLNFSQKSSISLRESHLNLCSSRKSSLLGNEPQILFNHKSSLETLLCIIKSFQMEYLTKN